jgi:hypothetical protein
LLVIPAKAGIQLLAFVAEALVPAFALTTSNFFLPCHFFRCCSSLWRNCLNRKQILASPSMPLANPSVLYDYLREGAAVQVPELRAA